MADKTDVMKARLEVARNAVYRGRELVMEGMLHLAQGDTVLKQMDADADADWHRMLAEVIELQKDKARLDFLAQQGPGDRWKATYEARRGFWTLHSFDTLGVSTLREAIDKAQEDIAQAGSLDSG